MATISVVTGLATLTALQLWRRNISLSLFGAFAVTFLFHKPGFDSLITIFRKLSTDPKLYEVVLTIYFIYVIGEVMKVSGTAQLLQKAVEKVFPDVRLSTAFLPLLIGLLPMPGGAMFTAPLVEAVGRGSGLTNLEMMSANYWFRHSMEFFWVVYPAMVIASSFAGIPLRNFMLVMFPVALTAIVAGLFIFRPLSWRVKLSKDSLRLFFKSTWPILLVIFLVLAGLKGVWSVGIAAALAVMYSKKLKSFINGFKVDIVLLLVMVFLYKNTLETLRISDAIASELSSNVPPLILAAVMPLLLGMVTGITQATVGMSFPTIFSLSTSFGALPLAVWGYYFAVL
ncbi:MAG: uncharacterized protein PWP37_1523 [Thermotogota bacterium]|nr:uncharacterized protein [Thermotogota bacterium]MDK2865331.1 uncharacterized protein [Thermotogota bacterium]HCZ06051.1 hypothetical protein [Thermotogota bacterium]